MKSNYLIPNWPAPVSVKAYCTTRHGGHSHSPFNSMNLGNHVGDSPEQVAANREQLVEDLNLPASPVWINQIHSKDVALLEKKLAEDILSVDAVVTRQKNTVCVVMTADCLPILLCDQKGTQVAAIHAGWRGLASGIIFETLKKMEYDQNNPIMAWLGPAIGPSVFEIDETVKQSLSVLLSNPNDQAYFKSSKSNPDRYLANLYQIASDHLSFCGVNTITGGEYCTYSQPELFFSYRQSGGLTGRMASLIWLT